MGSETLPVNQNPTRCLVTNTTDPIYECQIFRSPNDPRQIRQFEHAWGLKAGSLNFGVPRNKVFLTPDFCRTFELGNWALVPCLTTLKDIAVRAAQMLGDGSRTWPHYLGWFPDTTRYYCFVHFHGGPHIITRVKDGYRPNTRSFVVHEQPFEDLPAIESAIHPYFVICDVARKILDQRRMGIPVNKLPDSLQDCLNLCVGIYSQWIAIGLNMSTPMALGSQQIGLSQGIDQTQCSGCKRKLGEDESQADQSGSNNGRRRVTNNADANASDH